MLKPQGRLWVLTAIAVRFDPISILQPVAPGPLVSGRRVVALPDPVATLKTVTPLSSIDPPAFILHAEPVPLPLGPVALVGISAWPGVHPYDLEAVRPGPGVFALALGSGADAVPVGFAILPPPAVSTTVVEVKPSARHSDKRLGREKRRSRCCCCYCRLGRLQDRSGLFQNRRCDGKDDGKQDDDNDDD